MNNQADAKEALMRAWPSIVRECRQVLGSELHYQAMIYHCLRHYGKVPIDQIGMNVKMKINNPVSKFFKDHEGTRAEAYKGMVEPTPDIVIFNQSINGDWRRRNYENSLRNMLIAIEMKASERYEDRLKPKEIIPDIEKVAAIREEVQNIGSRVVPVMLIVDTAPEEKEQMTLKSIEVVKNAARKEGVCLFYLSRKDMWKTGWK